MILALKIILWPLALWWTIRAVGIATNVGSVQATIFDLNATYVMASLKRAFGAFVCFVLIFTL